VRCPIVGRFNSTIKPAAGQDASCVEIARLCMRPYALRYLVADLDWVASSDRDCFVAALLAVTTISGVTASEAKQFAEGCTNLIETCF
jgi:hypothetical protein